MRRLHRRIIITCTLLAALTGALLIPLAGPTATTQELLIEVPPLPPDGGGEVAQITELVRARPASGGITPQSYFGGASDCMEGDVLLRAVFVDSDGTAEAESFNWTDAEVNAIALKVSQEIEWTWSLFAPRYGKRVKVFVEKIRVPVPYEPVKHSADFNVNHIWVNPALSRALNRSYVGTTWEEAFNTAAEFGRLGRDGANQFGRTFDHATTLFFAPNGGGQRFTDGSTAFAYIGGPFGIVLRENYSIGTEERVAAHEFGHLFYAEDEYSGATRCNAMTNCNAVTAQEGRGACYNTEAKNGNCGACNSQSVSCVMQYNAHAICTHTPRLIGWLGPRLQEPVVTKIKCPGCTTGGKIVIKGTGFDAATKVYLNRVLYPQARYRPDYADIIVPGLRFGTGTFEVIVQRGSDLLYSDAFYKFVSAQTSTETEF